MFTNRLFPAAHRFAHWDVLARYVLLLSSAHQSPCTGNEPVQGLKKHLPKRITKV